MKRTLILSLTLLIATFSLAQQQPTQDKIEVEMHPLEYFRPEQLQDHILIVRDSHRQPNNSYFDRATIDLRYENIVLSLNETVKSAFNDVNRLQCTHRLSHASKGLQMTGIITGISLSAKHKILENKEKDGTVIKKRETTYNGAISVSITLTDPATQRFDTHLFERTSFNHDSSTTPFEIFQTVLRGIKLDIAQYYKEKYPLHAHILEIAEVKKDKVKKLYLDVGKYFDLQKGQHFNMFTLSKTAGHTTQTKIGRVKVEEIRGTDISLCDVQKGEEQIKEAIDKQLDIIAISD